MPAKKNLGGRPRFSKKDVVKTSSICFTPEDDRQLDRIMKRLKTTSRSRAVGWCIQRGAEAIRNDAKVAKDWAVGA